MPLRAGAQRVRRQQLPTGATSMQKTMEKHVRVPAPRASRMSPAIRLQHRPDSVRCALHATPRAAPRGHVLAAFSSGPYRPGSGVALAKFLDSDSQVHPEKMSVSVNPALYN